MSQNYELQCSCGKTGMSLTGSPRVRGHCHCEDCRDLLNIPYHSVNAWEKHQVTVHDEHEVLSEYQHPRLEMTRVFCSSCGDTLYNTNSMEWRVVSQHLVARNNNGTVPDELQSQSHFFYGRRVIDIDDELPKHD